jgi:hypothetical protein
MTMTDPKQPAPASAESKRPGAAAVAAAFAGYAAMGAATAGKLASALSHIDFEGAEDAAATGLQKAYEKVTAASSKGVTEGGAGTGQLGHGQALVVVARLRAATS